MARRIRIRRGFSVNTPSAQTLEGEPIYEMDVKKLRISDAMGNKIPVGDSDMRYNMSATPAATVTKEVNVASFMLAPGSPVYVRFAITNTAANPQLNVNGTGAFPIFYRNAALAAGTLAANRTYMFIFNGTQYEFVGDVDTNTTYTNMTPAELIAGTLSTGRVISAQTLTEWLTGRFGISEGNIVVVGPGGVIPMSLMPEGVLGQKQFQDTWNAATGLTSAGTALPSPSEANRGFFWVTTVAGTFQGTAYGLGDWIISTGNGWRPIPNVQNVISVAGRIGAVELVSGDVGLGNVQNFGIATQAQAEATDNLANDVYMTPVRTEQSIFARARNAVITGFNTAVSTAVTAADTIVEAIGKLQAQVSLHAPLISPAFTGNPTAPTQAAGNNSTRLATTEFVQNELSEIDGGTF